MADRPETTLGPFYEVLPEFGDATGNARLMAAFTPSNGIRIGIVNNDLDMAGWAEFDFTEDQAEAVGQALVRWAQRLRAETELVRCNADRGVRT